MLKEWVNSRRMKLHICVVFCFFSIAFCLCIYLKDLVGFNDWVSNGHPSHDPPVLLKMVRQWRGRTSHGWITNRHVKPWQPVAAERMASSPWLGFANKAGPWMVGSQWPVDRNSTHGQENPSAWMLSTALKQSHHQWRFFGLDPNDLELRCVFDGHRDTLMVIWRHQFHAGFRAIRWCLEGWC